MAQSSDIVEGGVPAVKIKPAGPSDAPVRPFVTRDRRMRLILARWSVVVIGIVLVVALGFLIGDLLRKEGQGTSPVLKPDGVRYSMWGPYPVGYAPRAGDGNAPLGLAIWYPAVQGSQHETATSYPYEVKFGRPLGTLAVASYQGRAIPEATPNPSMGPYPLVILSSGFSIGPTSYAWLAEHLASYGFIVVAPDHEEHLDPENELWRAVITRPQDTLALLTYLDAEGQTGEGPIGLIDQDTVAVIGHSFGGYTALAAAGARIDTHSFRASCESVSDREQPGAWLCAKLLPRMADMAETAGLESIPDGLWPAWPADQVDAIVPMAGNGFFFGQAGLSGISVPVMAIGGTADADSPYMWGTYPTYEYASSTTKARVALEGAGHMIFAGPCEEIPWYLGLFSGEFCSDQSWDRTYAHGLIKHFVTAFLLAELRADAAAEAAVFLNDLDIPGVTYAAEGFGGAR